MSPLRRLALLTAVVAIVFTVSCADQTPTPDTQDLPVELDGLVQPDIPADTLATLDPVRKAELSRRARRPAGDPDRAYALNYAGVVNRKDSDGQTRKPKPAEAMPATSCRSVEPVPKRADQFTGPHRLHDLTVHQFESQSGFGFYRMLFFENKRGVPVSSKDIDRVELVSLLTAAEPSAYVLDEMATPTLARQANRRPLDEFERRGLAAVRKGEELVRTREAPKRMFGAIRAKESCLDCHTKAKEGDLLGAFTYYLEVPADQVER